MKYIVLLKEIRYPFSYILDKNENFILRKNHKFQWDLREVINIFNSHEEAMAHILKMKMDNIAEVGVVQRGYKTTESFFGTPEDIDHNIDKYEDRDE